MGAFVYMQVRTFVLQRQRSETATRDLKVQSLAEASARSKFQRIDKGCMSEALSRRPSRCWFGSPTHGNVIKGFEPMVWVTYFLVWVQKVVMQCNRLD
jgi:hypothetical protein